MKRRSDGRWQKRITLPDGKSKLLYSTASTERLANKDFNEQMLNLKKEKEDSELFEIIAEKWKEKSFPDLENNTLKQYRPCYNAAVNFFSGMKVKDITPSDIYNYIDFLSEKKYAENTIKNRLLLVSLILGYAVLHNKIQHNPCSEIKLKTSKKALKKNIRDKASDTDEKKITNYKQGVFGVMAYLFLVTGLRRGEMAALKPENITPEVVHVKETVEWLGNKPRIKLHPKTEAGIREVPITYKTYELIKPFLKNKYIFLNNKKELFSNSEFTRGWNKLKKEIGIDCTPHQLRHSYATILFDAGIDVKTAQKWLGHSDINTTLAIYTHLSEKMLQKNTNKIKEYLSDNF